MDGFGGISLAGENWAFFLDIDGTLIDIAPTPDTAIASPETIALVGRLATRFGGAVALVSGRTIADIDRLFAPLKTAAAGLHGIERRTAAGVLARAPVPHKALEMARAALAGIEQRMPGVLIEDKSDTIAIHYRLAPEREATILTVAGDIVAASDGELEYLRGKMLAELRPPGPNKGNAVLAFMAEPPFVGRGPVFIGDDVTDEDGFRTVNRLGGHSVRVGTHTGGIAKYYMRDPAQLHRFLTTIIARPTDARP